MRARLAISALVAVVFFIGLASGLFLLPFWVQPFLTAAEKGNPSDWIGFAGSFGAGVMTLIAAIVAWFAVKGQIESQERAFLRAREEAAQERDRLHEDAKRAAKTILQPAMFASAIALQNANAIKA